jgi:hypothetical protein
MIIQTDSITNYNPNIFITNALGLFTVATTFILILPDPISTIFLTNWYKLTYTLLDIHNLSIILMGAYSIITLLIGIILWIILIGILSFPE